MLLGKHRFYDSEKESFDTAYDNFKSVFSEGRMISSPLPLDPSPNSSAIPVKTDITITLVF